MNNAPASWTAVTESSESPLWHGLSERLGPSQAALILPESESGDYADSVAAVQKLAPVRHVSDPRASVLDCGDERSEVTALGSAVQTPIACILTPAGRGRMLASCPTTRSPGLMRPRTDLLHRGLLKVTSTFGWQLEAWAVFSNHYHFVAHSPANEETAESVSAMLAELHKKTALWVNRLHTAPGRQVWFNYRETRLTFQRSYLARLNYVHQNPVKHGLVAVASQYPWCSARWFERTASAAQVRSIYRFKLDQVRLGDDFVPSGAW